MAATMLTAQQVQDLLDVDASTIYRMAGDGRLPAVRIGRQWRFPADAIEQLLVPAGRPAPVAVAPARHRPATGRSLPADLATALLDTVAHALGVTMVVTDLGGRALTPIVNPAPAIARSSTTRRSVRRLHRRVARTSPTNRTSRPGCSSVGSGSCAPTAWSATAASLVAMVLAGGIAPERTPTTPTCSTSTPPPAAGSSRPCRAPRRCSPGSWGRPRRLTDLKEIHDARCWSSAPEPPGRWW
jgi:excisionase family DNA binding protein